MEGLDYETFGTVNLKVHGLDRYINDSSFQALIASVATEGGGERTYDFVFNPEGNGRGEFYEALHTWEAWNSEVIAHNVGFERAVTRWMTNQTPDLIRNMRDSAVLSRLMGAGSKLEVAAPQLTTLQKVPTGAELIQKFSVPNAWNGGRPPTADLISADPLSMQQWEEFKYYCEQDAKAALFLRLNYEHKYNSAREDRLELLTWQMNQVGWRVDLDIVTEMKVRYEQNVQDLLERFRKDYKVSDKFFNSPKQLKDFCAERGVRATGFDQDKVAVLKDRLEKALAAGGRSSDQQLKMQQVLDMLTIKQELGGSSLKKLQTILNLVGLDGQLRNQYLHCGAGQTYRTSGVGAQLQNLKRLPPEPLDMETLYDQDLFVDNETLGENLRQVFTAQNRDGMLIVGDFSAVESRGLAYLAGEEWKLDAYREKKDIYKVLASKFQGISYEEVTKEARAEGKYSELSCGYQAGGQAVKDFMHKLGFEVSLDGAKQRVNDWRTANPEIVKLWYKIDELLHAVMLQPGVDYVEKIELAHDLSLIIRSEKPPASLHKQNKEAKTLYMRLVHQNGTIILERVFQGAYYRGTSVCYYKPSELKSGDLWRDSYIHPKTKKRTYYSIYGGKLSGILTQSLCRELFFTSLISIDVHFHDVPNVQIIGQFHDEIVLDWRPPQTREQRALSLQVTMDLMESAMSSTIPELRDFPLVADIKHDYRYTK